MVQSIGEPVPISVGGPNGGLPAGAKRPPSDFNAGAQRDDLRGELELPQLVELIGLFSASLVGSVAIRRMRGSSMPYAVPMASLLVKLPTGALTAVAGLLLIRAGVLGPDVASAGTAQLVAYALVFGASQQAFTRLVDIQTQNVLDSIPTPTRDAAKNLTTATAAGQSR